MLHIFHILQLAQYMVSVCRQASVFQSASDQSNPKEVFGPALQPPPHHNHTHKKKTDKAGEGQKEKQEEVNMKLNFHLFWCKPVQFLW